MNDPKRPPAASAAPADAPEPSATPAVTGEGFPGVVPGSWLERALIDARVEIATWPEWLRRSLSAPAAPETATVPGTRCPGCVHEGPKAHDPSWPGCSRAPSSPEHALEPRPPDGFERGVAAAARILAGRGIDARPHLSLDASTRDEIEETLRRAASPEHAWRGGAVSRRTLAPALRRFVAERRCNQDECGGSSECHRVAAELHALLAVARAAEGVRRHVEESGYEGLEGPADKALFRALARLARVSGGVAGTARSSKPASGGTRGGVEGSRKLPANSPGGKARRGR